MKNKIYALLLAFCTLFNFSLIKCEELPNGPQQIAQLQTDISAFLGSNPAASQSNVAQGLTLENRFIELGKRYPNNAAVAQLVTALKPGIQLANKTNSPAIFQLIIITLQVIKQKGIPLLLAQPESSSVYPRIPAWQTTADKPAPSRKAPLAPSPVFTYPGLPSRQVTPGTPLIPVSATATSGTPSSPAYRGTPSRPAPIAPQVANPLASLPDLVVFKPKIDQLNQSQKDVLLSQVKKQQAFIDKIIFDKERDPKKLFPQVTQATNLFFPNLKYVDASSPQVITIFKNYLGSAEQQIQNNQTSDALITLIKILMALDEQLFELSSALETNNSPKQESTIPQAPPLSDINQAPPVPPFNPPLGKNSGTFATKPAVSEAQLKPSVKPAPKLDYPVHIIRFAQNFTQQAQDMVSESWEDLDKKTAITKASTIQKEILYFSRLLAEMQHEGKSLLDTSDGQKYGKQIDAIINAPDNQYASNSAQNKALRKATAKLVDWFENELEGIKSGKYYRTLLSLQLGGGITKK